MLRKSFFNVRAITVKIAAIEHRSKFYINGHGGQYTGFELGADIGSGINLDDYLVFDNDEERSTGFFADLFFRHMTSIANERGLVGPETPQELIRNAFTQDRAFQQLVRASEGVPRDAIHILANAAQRANNKQISIPNIRQAARVFYQTDKSDVVTSAPILNKFLQYVIDTVIGERNTSIFLLETGNRNELLDRLFDRRILHVKSRNGSSRDHKGMRFLIYKIDYGCYIDLIYTKRFPSDTELSAAITDMSLSEDDELFRIVGDKDRNVGTVEVPQDDKRSYRSAVLDLMKFQVSLAAGAADHDKAVSV